MIYRPSILSNIQHMCPMIHRTANACVVVSLIEILYPVINVAGKHERHMNDKVLTTSFTPAGVNNGIMGINIDNKIPSL